MGLWFRLGRTHNVIDFFEDDTIAQAQSDDRVGLAVATA